MAVAKTSRRVLAREVAAQLLANPSRQKQIMNTLAAYLIENKMTSQEKLIINDIAHEIFVQSGELSVTVTSARPLTESSRKQLSSVIRQDTGAKEVAITEQIDQSLLGGFVARTPDQEIDVSVRSRLKQLAAIK